jgi:hypothetical protein
VNALNPSSQGTGGGSGGYNNYQHILIGIRPGDGSGFVPALELSAKITSSIGTEIRKKQPFTVSYNVINSSLDIFNGSYGIHLLDSAYTLIKKLGNISTTSSPLIALPPDYSYNSSFSFAIHANMLNDIEPGNYYLAAEYCHAESNQWLRVGATLDYQNPVPITIQAPLFLEDIYEPNNVEHDAYLLPVSFSNHIARIKTSESNFHTETDCDFYKMNLPEGYNYTLNPRLYDSYSEDVNTYTANALFAYKIEDSLWSEIYNHEIPYPVTIENGGTIYFKITQDAIDTLGSYLLDVQIERTSNISVKNHAIAKNIQIYPNPNNGIFTISSCFENSIPLKITNLLGKTIFSETIYKGENQLYLTHLSRGVYFINFNIGEKTYSEKIILSH